MYGSGFSIDKIYIPYIGAEKETILYFILQYKDRNNNIMEEIQRNDTRIIEVAEAEEIFPVPFWKFNIHQSKFASYYVEEIIEKLNEIGIRTKADVNRVLATKQPQIKNAYKKVIHNLNLTSLFLEHGPVDDSSIKESVYRGSEFISGAIKEDINIKMHSLITGDCNLSVNISTINRYADILGYILVPHHSGSDEWDTFLCESTKPAVWIVTISEVRSRPYGLVVHDIYSNNCELYICDKVKPFEYRFEV